MRLLSELRSELQGVLKDMGLNCSVRRCQDAAWLLSLPLAMRVRACEWKEFLARCASLGWEGTERDGWLLMRRDVPVPEIGGEEPCRLQTYDGESGALLSLLYRHPDGPAPSREMIYALLKADESGAAALEQESRRLHGIFAACLRKHEPIPNLIPYLCACLTGQD